MKRSLLFTLLLITLHPVYSTDTLTICEKLRRNAQPTERIPLLVWDNPAMMYHAADYSLSEIRMGTLGAKRNRAALQQEGNGSVLFGVNTESYILLNDKSRVFGEVKYKNGKRHNIRWNETSDFALLYPYVIGDSIGGNLNTEEYFFAGGYTRQTGQWTLGVQFKYRALIEYRNIDPRPKNVVSDFRAGAGAARTLGNHRIGGSLHVQRYDQKSSISFYNDLGTTSLYQLTGLGMHYIRFAGDHKSATYTGGAWGGSIDILPVEKQGMFATITYNRFRFTKYLTDNLPLVAAAEKSVRTEGGYLGKGIVRGIVVSGRYNRRIGTENIFGEPVSNLYPLISTSKPYRATETVVQLSGIAGQPEAGWFARTTAGFEQRNVQHQGAKHKVQVTAITGNIEGGAAGTTGRWGWQATGGITVAGNVKRTNKPEIAGGIRNDGIAADLRYISDNRIEWTATVGGNYALNTETALIFTANTSHGFYRQSGTTSEWTISVGLAF